MLEQFRNKIPVDDEQWDRYVSCFKRITVPAKTRLLTQGEKSTRLFLIEEGCIRVWFDNKGKDITFQFFFENNVVASIESFRKSIPSPVSIEAIEQSTLWWIHKKDMDRIFREVMGDSKLGALLVDGIFERTYTYMTHFLSSIRDTPTQRYLNLLKEKPQIIKRVPQHYIASYLGVSTVHLSRIRREVSKMKS